MQNKDLTTAVRENKNNSLKYFLLSSLSSKIERAINENLQSENYFCKQKIILLQNKAN